MPFGFSPTLKLYFDRSKKNGKQVEPLSPALSSSSRDREVREKYLIFTIILLAIAIIVLASHMKPQVIVI